MPDFQRLVETSAYCLGWAVERFEENFARFIGAEHAIGVSWAPRRCTLR